jgi:hypothetical protein
VFGLLEMSAQTLGSVRLLADFLFDFFDVADQIDATATNARFLLITNLFKCSGEREKSHKANENTNKIAKYC